MIHISDTAKKINEFLKSKGEEKFKIFIRINFCIDVYVCTSNEGMVHKYQKEFFYYLEDNNKEEAGYKDSFYKEHSKSIRVVFTPVSPEECIDDPFYANIFSNNENVIDMGPRYRFESLLRTKDKKTENTYLPPIVTFYSYKGGMGRTTAMVAYAMQLAINDKKRVVVIDCDLEAPGYLNFFNLSKHEQLKSGKINGLVEFICDAQLTQKPEMLNIDDYAINIGYGTQNEVAYKNLNNIWLVPAGNLNEGYNSLGEDSGADRNDYLEGLAKINLSSVDLVTNYFELLFKKLNERYSPDIILIDSRTGFNDIFGSVALYLSSSVVGFFGFSKQTHPGLINLLQDYYKPSNDFKLYMVFSILPEGASEKWIDKKKKETMDYINLIANEEKDYPPFLYLHRNPLLEIIGTDDEDSDTAFVELIKENKFTDYNVLFEALNKLYFKKEENRNRFTSNTPALDLRNTILRHLKDVLANVKNFAEDAEVNEDQFFYRDCMKELFDQRKFLIRGYKGTGKTYLYKALADKNLAANIQKWAEIEDAKVFEPVFVNILPLNQTDLIFPMINYRTIDDTEYYFNMFWQIYTWNKLLLHSEFSHIRQESELSQYILPIEGPGYAEDALTRIEKLIDEGVKVLGIIKRDIIKINNFLAEERKRLFILYDRLDTCINPIRWSKAVSPLINYWWNNFESYSNISPKVFVRTDLFKLIHGTNTARLENHIINIEWSIGEVFGFFFKLIFANKDASEAYWAIAEKVNIGSKYIADTKDTFAKFPYNQFKYLTQKEMTPIIRVFFGNEVKGTSSLGTPWQYFERELANADNSAISLRPFINTLDSNAVDEALAKSERYVQSIISYEIYASRTVREKTTETYFNDLAHDEFSQDLSHFRDVVRSSKKKYTFKELNEDLYEELISDTFNRIVDSSVVKTPEDLTRLIEANGIMAKIPTRKGNYYRFAPIYWYSWGLANSELEKNEKKESKKAKLEDDKPNLSHAKPYKRRLVDGEEFEGEVRKEYDKEKHCRVLKIKCDEHDNLIEMRVPNMGDFFEGADVTFTAHLDIEKHPGHLWWYADNIQFKD